MDKIFQRLVENNFSELVGLTVEASVLVPEGLINELIESALRGNRHISSCSMSIHPENRVSVDLKSRLVPLTLHVRLKLFRSVDLTNSPKIRAFLENNILLGRLGSLLHALPEGVTLYEDQIAVDIGAFLSMPEQKRFLSLLKAVEIKTEEGKMNLDVNISVDEATK